MKKTGSQLGEQMNNLPYIFIIGINKTATRSLDYFFKRNGFPGIHWDYGNLALTMLGKAGNM